MGEHSHPTASVNVVKGVWFCYSCQGRGAVDSNRAPTVDELAAMLEPEVAARIYPTSWLTTFGVGGYWAERFPLWLCWQQGLGEDPWTGEGTYPVHTAAGTLAGVSRRALTDGPWPKYKYPRTWSASRALFGSRGAYLHHDVLMLVEGAADAAAGWEVGCPTYATYGSGVHAPQVELVARMTPRLILLGQDNDEAGDKGADQAAEALAHIAPLVRVDWQTYKDPAEVPAHERTGLLARHVTREDLHRWQRSVMTLMTLYDEETRG